MHSETVKTAPLDIHASWMPGGVFRIGGDSEHVNRVGSLPKRQIVRFCKWCPTPLSVSTATFCVACRKVNARKKNQAWEEKNRAWIAEKRRARRQASRGLP